MSNNSNAVEILFQREVYSLESVKRSAYCFSGHYSFEISINDETIVCKVKSLDDAEFDVALVTNRFRNAVLDYGLRESIAKQTEGVRNLILAHAFSKTGLQEE